MAVFQTLAARRKEAAPAAYASGLDITTVTDFTFGSAYVAAADRIELFALPAGARLLSLRLIFANIGAVNTTLGVVSGDFGTTDNARTVGTELFAAQSMVNGEVTVPVAACLAIGRDQTKHRGIGMRPAADIAAGGTKTVTVVATYQY
jgi:hypothetical protein